MNWLIEEKYATELNYPNIIKYNSLKALTEELPSKDCIFRGSIGSAHDILRRGKPNIRTYLGYSKDSFNANKFMESFGELALNKNHTYMTWGQIKRNSEKSLFCRPVSGWKTFSGGLLNKDNMFDRLIEEKLPDHTLCLIAPPVNITKEYRLIIAEQEIFGVTQYLPEESSVVDENIIKFTKELISKIQEPDLIYCLDIAETENSLFALETGSFTTCGLYAMDMSYLCPKVENYITKIENEV